MHAIHERLAPLKNNAGARLKAMRMAAGSELTQRQLGEFAGCSTVLIKKIESGNAKLTNDLAQRISIATGVCPFWLQYGIDGAHLHSAQFREILANDSFALADIASETPIKSGGGAFTQEAFNAHKVATQSDPINDAHRYGHILAANVVQLLRAAARSRKLSVALYAMRHAIFEIVEQFDLESEFQRQSIFHEFATDTPIEEEKIDKVLAATTLFRIRDARTFGNLDNVRDDMLRDIDRAKSAVQMMCSPNWPTVWKKRQQDLQLRVSEFQQQMSAGFTAKQNGKKAAKPQKAKAQTPASKPRKATTKTARK